MPDTPRPYATVEDLLSWSPCWLDEGGDGEAEADIREIASPRREWYVEHVVALRGTERLSDTDWRWLLLRYLAETGRVSTVVLWSANCAERALTREREAGREPDPRSWAAVATARRWARGEATDEEVIAAAADVWSVRSARSARSAADAASAADATVAAARAAAAATDVWSVRSARSAAAAARSAEDQQRFDAWSASVAEREWQHTRLATLALAGVAG